MPIQGGWVLNGREVARSRWLYHDTLTRSVDGTGGPRHNACPDYEQAERPMGHCGPGLHGVALRNANVHRSNA